MSNELRIRVPWTPTRALNPNTHKGWRGKHPDQANAHATCKVIATQVRRERPDWSVPDMPVLTVVIAWGKGQRRLDDDNAIAAVKHGRDGICAGLGFDDKRFITSMAFQKRDRSGAGFTEFIIRPATADERRLAA